MKERPILFSAPMVRAILDGRKTQTRRTVRELPGNKGGLVGEHVKWFERGQQNPKHWCGHDGLGSLGWVVCPYGDCGDRLWVRETFTHITGNGIRVHYRSDGEPTDSAGRVLPTDPGCPRWRPSIFMRRHESRITLEVTEVRVQRLQEISAADACDEGATAVLEDGHPLRSECFAKHGSWTGDPRKDVDGPFAGSIAAFATLWDSINGKRAPWSSNPWVWAISFLRVKP